MTLSSLLSVGKHSALTSFFSVDFFVLFLPVCIILYSLMPKKWKKYFLLASSWVFFSLISGGLIVYLFFSILMMYFFGKKLDKMQCVMREKLRGVEKSERVELKKKFVSAQKRVVALAVILQIGVVIVLKYSSFLAVNAEMIMGFYGVSIKITVPKFLMPIGLSFFSLQALSYIIDVYRGVVKADGNIFRLALFLSFFPQIVEGPICRYSQTAEKLWNVGRIKYSDLTQGYQRILFGMMKKIVVADRLAPFVDNVFKGYSKYSGGVIAIAAVCYTIQLYMDFSGSMDAVSGTAQIFGIEMPENFRRPFFSKTISEFWTRWHVTLGMWFRDYIFFPVTTSKKMKNVTSSARKKFGNHYGPLVAGSVALFCVWFCNGLWHGSAWSFIFFGMYHFILILTGNIISPLVNRVNEKLHIDPKCAVYRLFQTIRTIILVIVGELFFRAEGLLSGVKMFRKMVTDPTVGTFDEKFLKKLGVDMYDFKIVAVTLVIVFVVSLLNEKGVDIRETLSRKNILLRWSIFYLLIMYIIIFGAYGFDYVPVDPIYAQF